MVPHFTTYTSIRNKPERPLSENSRKVQASLTRLASSSHLTDHAEFANYLQKSFFVFL